MTTRATTWAWALELWTTHFAPLAEGGLVLERVDEETYWPLHEAELRAHFPPEVFFEFDVLGGDARRARHARLDASLGGTPLREYVVVRDGVGGPLVAMFAGSLARASTYRMEHSNVHPTYRRRGIYQRILACTIAYTAALGVDMIESDHAPSNSPILRAKLAAGFRITTMDVDASVGPSLVLRYFHDPQQLAAYEFRCGLATLTPAMVAGATGAIAQLRAQLAPSG